MRIGNAENRGFVSGKVSHNPLLRFERHVSLHAVRRRGLHPLPRVEHQAELRGHGVEAASGDHKRAALLRAVVVRGLDALHELGLAGDVKVVTAGGRAGSDDRLAVEAEGSDTVEEEARAGAEGAEGGGVGGVGGEDGEREWRIGPGGPFQGLGKLSWASARYGDGLERRGWSVQEFEGFSENVFACEARRPQYYNIETTTVSFFLHFFNTVEKINNHNK